jgi:hypothetical protein
VTSSWAFASFLLKEREKPSKVVAAAAGLIVYGATTQEKLQGVAENKEEFKRQLAEEGVPKAICDMLFLKVRGPGLIKSCCYQRAGQPDVGR